MASGDIVAVLGVRDERFEPAQVGGAPQKFVILSGVIGSTYAGGGVHVKLHLAKDRDNTGTKQIHLEAYFQRLVAGTDTKLERPGVTGSRKGVPKGFATSTVNETSVTVDNSNGKLFITTITIPNGVRMDSCVAGSPFRLAVLQDADGIASPADGAALVHLVTIAEQ